MSDDDDEFTLDTVFTEPPPPPTPEPTVSVYVRDEKALKVSAVKDWDRIDISLVGAHPLWGHYLWNAARAFAAYLDFHPEIYRERCVLELGAGGGLPSIVAVKNGAKKVVITDYPDSDLMQNIEYNVEANVPDSLRGVVNVQGYIWGHPVKSLLDVITYPNSESQKFDLIILSDLVFNHSQHDALLKACDLTLKSNPSPASSVDFSSSLLPSVLVFYTHHRPHLAHRDLEFFKKAQEQGWSCKEILTEKFPPMFPEDSGEESVRSTVHGWRLNRQV